MVQKEPREWTFCPVCGKKYSFVNCRLSEYKNGVRFENCTRCSIERGPINCG